MTGEQLRTRYFGAMRSGDLEAVQALFADDAAAILPDGVEHVGQAALTAMFAGIFANGPQPQPGPITGTGKYWAVEVETRLPNGEQRYTANFFTLNDAGLIERMHSYRRL